MEKQVLSYISSLLLAAINPRNTMKPVEFEKHFSRFVGVKHAVFTNSGREAIYLALKSLDLPEGSKVWLPTFSCIHVISPLLRLGLTPMLVDIDENTFNMDPDWLREHIGGDSRALIVQHTYGYPARIDEFKEICQQHDLFLIEDCAMALGSEVYDKKAGAHGDLSIFSLTKNMINFEGGVVCTNESSFYSKMKQHTFTLPHVFHSSLSKRNLIMFRLEKLRSSLFETFRYSNTVVENIQAYLQRRSNIEHIFEIYHRPSDLSATLAYLQLEKISYYNKRRLTNANFFKYSLLGNDIDPAKIPSNNSHFKGIALYIPIFFSKKSAPSVYSKIIGKLGPSLVARPWRPLHLIYPALSRHDLGTSENVFRHLLVTPNSPYYSQEKLLQLRDILLHCAI